MIRRGAARACNRMADWLFLAADRLVRIAYRLDPGNNLIAGLAAEAAQLSQGHK
jgi:hypothetical protein